AVLQPFDAKLFFSRGERRFVSTGKNDEGGEICALRQIFRELEAGARRSRVSVDGIVEHPETPLLPQMLVLGANIGRLPRFEREPERIQRRPPQLALAHDIAE